MAGHSPYVRDSIMRYRAQETLGLLPGNRNRAFRWIEERPMPCQTQLDR